MADCCDTSSSMRRTSIGRWVRGSPGVEFSLELNPCYVVELRGARPRTVGRPRQGNAWPASPLSVRSRVVA